MVLIAGIWVKASNCVWICSGSVQYKCVCTLVNCHGARPQTCGAQYLTIVSVSEILFLLRMRVDPTFVAPLFSEHARFDLCDRQ